jgi:hypothetical protein
MTIASYVPTGLSRLTQAKSDEMAQLQKPYDRSNTQHALDQQLAMTSYDSCEEIK